MFSGGLASAVVEKTRQQLKVNSETSKWNGLPDDQRPNGILWGKQQRKEADELLIERERKREALALAFAIARARITAVLSSAKEMSHNIKETLAASFNDDALKQFAKQVPGDLRRDVLGLAR